MTKKNAHVLAGALVGAAGLVSLACDRREREPTPAEPASPAAEQKPTAQKEPAETPEVEKPAEVEKSAVEKSAAVDKGSEAEKEPVAGKEQLETQSADEPKGKQGRITLRLLGDRVGSVDYAFKGDKMRIGLRGTGENVDAFVDRSDKELTLVARDEKKYMTVDLDDLVARARKEAKKVDLKKTGRTERFAGIACEWWELSHENRTVEACVASGPQYFDPEMVEKLAGIDLPAWAERVVEEGYFPVRVLVRDAAQKGRPVFELERWSTAPVSEEDLEVPKGYQRVGRGDLEKAVKQEVKSRAK